MKQGEHLFQFSGADIAKAARAEFDYHTIRQAFWETEQGKIVEQARSLTATIKIREQQVTGGKRYEIVADITGAQDLNWRLGIAATKIEHHRQLADEFWLKAIAYETQPDRHYELDPQDVAYFRLNGGKREE